MATLLLAGLSGRGGGAGGDDQGAPGRDFVVSATQADGAWNQRADVIEKLTQESELGVIPLASGPWWEYASGGSDPATATYGIANFEVIENATEPAAGLVRRRARTSPR